MAVDVALVIDVLPNPEDAAMGTGCCWSSCTACPPGARWHRSAPAGCSPALGNAPASESSNPISGIPSPRLFLDASGGNLVIARDAGGWASAAMVDGVYGHVDVHDPVFDAALRTVWGDAR